MHEEFEEFAVGGSEEVDEFVDDDEFAEVFGYGQEGGVEGEPARGGDGDSFSFSRLVSLRRSV